MPDAYWLSCVVLHAGEPPQNVDLYLYAEDMPDAVSRAGTCLAVGGYSLARVMTAARLPQLYPPISSMLGPDPTPEAVMIGRGGEEPAPFTMLDPVRYQTRVREPEPHANPTLSAEDVISTLETHAANFLGLGMARSRAACLEGARAVRVLMERDAQQAKTDAW